MSGVSEFAKLLRRYRLEAGWTQEQLAHKCTVSVRTISDLERGRIARPRSFTAEQLAGTLPLSREQRDQLLSAARQPGNHVAKVAPALDVQNAIAELVGRADELKYLTSSTNRLVSCVEDGVAVVLVVLITA